MATVKKVGASRKVDRVGTRAHAVPPILARSLTGNQEPAMWQATSSRLLRTR